MCIILINVVEIMNVLSLFDGIAGAKLALNRAKIKVENYYASEIDKYAIKVAKSHHSDIIHIGDVTRVNWFGLPKIDLLIAGFPCQGFSFAGKQLNFDDPRSKLFFEVVRLIKELQPTYFLLENVVMKKEYEEKISNLIGVKPILINSALVSAQNRKRLYWTNITNITQPKDKNIFLKDIIEDNGIGSIKSNGTFKLKNDKSQCLDANYHKGVDNHGQRTMIMLGDAELPTSRKSDKRVYSIEGKSPALLANSGGHKEPKIATLKSQSIAHPNNEAKWRKLTVKECCRLQTIPDNYFDGIVSNSQAYKALGNGFTVDVIAHILQNIK